MAKPLQSPSLLKASALDRIARAVANAETATSCELVVVLAPASSRYEGRALKAGAAAALLTFLALYWVLRFMTIWPPDALWLLAESCVIGALATLAFSRVAIFKRLLISRAATSAMVSSTSNAVFMEQKVASTREHNAVLIFISLFEGEARVVADQGLNGKIPESVLNEVQARLNETREGDSLQLVEGAITSIGSLCAGAFPRRPDDQNELPDSPVIRLP